MRHQRSCLAVVLLLSGCGGLDESSSGIEGTVWLGPMCPVQRDPPDPDCEDKRYEADLVLTRGTDGRVVKSFRSDADGRFNVSASPGEYGIRSKEDGKLPHCSTQEPILVTANRYTTVTVNCDTGIR